jgi:hypothetical protein
MACSDTGYHCDYSESSEYTSFFIKPKLKLRYDSSNSDYSTTLELTDSNGNSIGVKRHWLKILVINEGAANAVRCIGELKVVQPTEIRHPSDTKVLSWVSDASSRYINIGRKSRKEFMHIAFADSDFAEKHAEGQLDIYAYASTKDLVFSRVLSTRTQDAFGIGDFQVEVSVTGEGFSMKQRIILHVDKNYEALNLDIIPNNTPKLQKLKAKLGSFHRGD